MSGNTSERPTKRPRVGDDAGSAEDAAPIAASAPSNENHHAPSAVEENDIKVILSPKGTITEAHLKKTLGSICDSLGRPVYMVDPAELGSMVYPTYTRKTAIEKSIEHCSTILLPMLENGIQRRNAKHWILMVVSRETNELAPLRLYRSSHPESRIGDTKGMTAAFLDKYLADSKFKLQNTLSTCCETTDKNASGVCVFAFGMHVIAQRIVPRNLSVDIWRLIMAYLLGFKDDNKAREKELFLKRNLDKGTLASAFGALDRIKLEKHLEDANNYIDECKEIAKVLREVLDQITGTSGGGQSRQDTTEAGSDEGTSSRARTIRGRLELTINHLSGLENKMRTRRDETLSVIEDLKVKVTAATART